jgi:hypothetical protein
MSIVGRIRRWMLVVASGYATYMALCAIAVAGREAEPTRLAAGDFASGRYQGQQWLTVSGWVNPSEAVTRPGGEGRVNVWVPVHEDAGGPVHILVLMGPMSDTEAGSRLAALPTGPAEFTGSQVSFDPDQLIPNLPKADPIVMIQVGNAPTSAGAAWAMFGLFAVIFLLAVTLEGRAIYRSVRGGPKDVQPAAALSK